MVVTYMNTMGMPAYAGLRLVWANHTVTISRLNAAMSWLDAPKSCHRYTQVPDRSNSVAAIIETTVATCWFLNPPHASPNHSPNVTRMRRKISWVTVSTMTTNAPNPSAVPYPTGSAPKVPTLSKRPTPLANATPPAPPEMDTAVSESSPNAFSLNMAPPPTGRPSVSYSNWRAVPTEPNRACHPEIAPQAMVTNNIGHSGWKAPVGCGGRNPLNAAALNTATVGLRKGANTAPMALPIITSPVIQNPM